MKNTYIIATMVNGVLAPLHIKPVSLAIAETKAARLRAVTSHIVLVVNKESI